MKSAILADCTAFVLAATSHAAGLGTIMSLGDLIAWGDAQTWSGGDWGLGTGTGTDTPIGGGWRTC